MTAFLLAAAAGFFLEISSSIGKHELLKKKESLYAVGFLGSVWATLFLLIWTLVVSKEFVFSIESLPTFLLRAVLEVILVFVSLGAIRDADRSTFAFLRVLTIPVLLLVDVILGYSLSSLQIGGVLVLLIAFLMLASGHALSSKGKLLAASSALLAVATIALYKYNITHFNSVEAEQSIMHAITFTAIIIAAVVQGRENVFKYLLRPLCLIQSFAAGIAAVCMSFAYAFVPASIALTMKRSFEMGAAVIFGRAYFAEQKPLLKFVALALMVCGIVLITF